MNALKPPLKILVIEHDPDTLNALNIALASVGFDVDVLLEGSRILLNQFAVPDLFIIDRRLPRPDGIELRHYLRSRPGYRSIPVIMISARSGTVREMQLPLGEALPERPLVMQELLERVWRTLGLVGTPP